MITTTYNYSSGTGFVYDSAKIGFSGAMAKLIAMPNPGVFTQDFASSAGFTFNAAYTEFTGGAMRQIGPFAGLLAYYQWSTALGSGLDGNYGTGAVAVTALSGPSPTIAGGVLNLTNGSGVSLGNAAAYSPQSIATIAFKYKPAYSGAPAIPQYMLSCGSGPAQLPNYMDFVHYSSGQITSEIYDSSGNGIGTLTTKNWGAFAPVADTTYEIVFQLDTISGATKLFIDGVQLGATDTSTGTRTAASIIDIGRDVYLSGTSPAANFSISEFSLSNAIIAPATCFTLPSPQAYNADTITLPTFSYTGLLNILAWTSLAITDANTPHYTFNGLYWNGSAWVASSTSYATANDAVTAAANIAALPAANSVGVKVYWQGSNVLSAGSMSVDLLTLNYTGQIYTTTNPTIAPNTPLTLDELDDFTSVFSASGSDGVQFYLAINSTNYWWNGSAWATSNGTYAQSNTAADILANSGTLPVTLGVFFTPYAILHSASGLTTPTLTSLTIVYDFFGEEPAGPNVCTVFGYLLDENKNPIAGATVTATNPATFFNQGIVQAQGSLSSTTDAEGYFHFSLMETATAAKQLIFAVRYPANPPRPPGVPGAASFGRAAVPNLPSVNFVDMVFS